MRAATGGDVAQAPAAPEKILDQAFAFQPERGHRTLEIGESPDLRIRDRRLRDPAVVHPLPGGIDGAHPSDLRQFESALPMPAADELRLVDLPGVVHRRQRIVAQQAQYRQFRTALIGIVRHHRCSDRSKRRRALSQPPPLHMRAILLFGNSHLFPLVDALPPRPAVHYRISVI
jgi:hypothetical protein